MDFAQPQHSGASAASTRKDLELYLIQHERFLTALLDSAAQAILGVDRFGHITLVNARCQEMFGYDRREMLGQDIEILLPVALREKHAQHRDDYVKNPHVRPMGIGMELSGRRKDGTEFPVEVSLSYIETGEGLFAIAFVTDITQRKRLEEQLLHAQKLEAVGRLAGGVAHDFNNMLTVISGYNRMLLDQLSPVDPLRGYSEEVLKAADRAAALTNQLLAFSRRQVMQLKVVDVNGLVSNAENMLRRLIGEDLDLIFSLSPNAGNTRADAGQFEQILFNLAVNARDAMPEGGRLTIETSAAHLDDDYVKTAVSDTGHGMDAETRRHIFEPFFTTKERGKGTGLGLATVYGIVKQSGGDIWVYSEVGKGTTFKVYLPRVDEPAPGGERPPAISPRAGHETLLVVEDERGVRELVTAMLTQHGYKVLKAADALEAVHVAHQHEGPIDLLLTDVMMPQMSGRELAKQLLPERPEMRVVYLSGYTENTVLQRGVLEPGVDFLAKPFSQEALARKLREVLDRRR